MRRSADFATAFRGARGGAHRLVVAIQTEPQADLHTVKVGFVVSKSVGNSVVRHRVTRQLRHLMRERLERFDVPVFIAVRALPAAAGARSEDLAKDLDLALAHAERKIAHAATRNSATEPHSGVVPPSESDITPPAGIGV